MHQLTLPLVLASLLFPLATQSLALQEPRVEVDGHRSRHALPLAGGISLQYDLLLPPDYDPARPSPTVLALPPGAQDEAMVNAGFDLYWAEQAPARGWVVISPVAPGGVSFFAGSEAHLPALIEAVSRDHAIEHGRVHVAGPSNGGRSAVRFATRRPDLVASLLLLPGYPPDDSDSARLGALLDVPVGFFVGGDDTRWVEASRKAHDALVGLGHPQVGLTVYPGEGHTPVSLTSSVVFDTLQGFRSTLLAEEAERTKIGAALDAFHLAAAEADGEAYFASFAPGAAFLGTDPAERWTVPEFRAFCEPYFDRGQGWLYTPTRRFVDVSLDGSTAWFDEDLSNESYGTTRGTGVLRRLGGRWLIAQYSLSIPVPNDLARDLVERIRGQDR